VDKLLADLRLSVRDLARNRRRTASAASAVAFGVTALMLAAGFIDWIFLAMRDATIHSQLGHFKVVRPGYFGAGTADPFAYLLPAADTQAVAAIEATPRVRVVAPRLSFSALLSHGDTTVSFVGEGVVPGKETELSRSISIVAGRSLQDGADDEIVVGEGMAAAAGVGPGDTVVLLANTASGGVNAVEVRVAGIFASAIKAYDDWAVRLPLPLAHRLLRVSGAHSWTVLLDRTDQTEATVAALRANLPAAEYELVPWTALADFYNKTVALFSRQVGFVRWVIAIIIVLSIANSMMMTVMERTGEIGTSMALGVRRSRIRRQFLIEGAMLGILGGLAGVVLGVLLANAISAIGIPMPAPPGSARGYVGEILLTPGLVGEALALAIVTSVAASAYPAFKASRMAIVDALRHNR
jgi:putative ABC transport system permease protein